MHIQFSTAHGKIFPPFEFRNSNPRKAERALYSMNIRSIMQVVILSLIHTIREQTLYEQNFRAQQRKYYTFTL